MRQLQASPEPRSGKVRAPRAIQPAPIHVLREHSMPQGAGKTPHSRPEGLEINIRCILPRGHSGNTLWAVFGRLCRLQRDTPSGAERGAERTRRSLGVYGPGAVWRGRNESRGVTGWLVGIRPRGGLEGVRLAKVAWEGT